MKVYDAYVFVCMCACMREGVCVCVVTEGREGKRMREKVYKKEKMMEGER